MAFPEIAGTRHAWDGCHARTDGEYELQCQFPWTELANMERAMVIDSIGSRARV